MTENPSNDGSLDGTVAIVTGGSRGIGRAIASALLGRGARVAINGRDPGALQDAEAALRRSASSGRAGSGGGAGGDAGDRVLAVQADVSREQDATKLVNQTVERFGGLDLLVNNAGVGRFANVAEMPTERWHEVMETNVSGVFFCCRAALPHLKRRGGGWIINISSLASENAFIGGAAYCASKAALNAFTQALMLETRYDNIRVSMILPGSVQTEFAAPLPSSAAHPSRGPAGAGPSAFSGSQTAGADWKLTPEDVARAVVDLLAFPARSLPSRIDMRPSKPVKR
jgi:3-oxoacyl-[acyl-carrier protein] reductase